MSDNIKLSDSEFKRIAIQKGYEPVIRGVWLFFEGGWSSVYVCSRCGRNVTMPETLASKTINEIYPYCHCGAKMIASCPLFEEKVNI